MRLRNVQVFQGPNCHADWPLIYYSIETAAGLPAPAALQAFLSPLLPERIPFAGDDKRGGHTRPDQVAEVIARIANSFVAAIYPFATGFATVSSERSSASAYMRTYGKAPALTMLQVAMVLVGRALAQTPMEPHEQRLLTWVRAYCDQRQPNSESSMLISAAQGRNLPFFQVATERDLWQFGWGARSRLFWAHSSNGDGAFAHLISRDKHVSKALFRSLGLPTPSGGVVRAGEDFRPAARLSGWPCVVKPLDRGGGRGVNAGIRDMVGLQRAVAIARSVAPEIIIESHIPGLDHRLVVIDGRLAMAARRDPPTVIGDGRSTIAELLEALNTRRLQEKENGLKAVLVDAALDATLASQKLTRDSVLPIGTEVLLRRNANHATGGTFRDVLGLVHPQIRESAVALARAVGFRVVGLDYLTTDISRTYEEVGGAFIEMNATPTLGAFVLGSAAPPEIADWALGETVARIPACLLLVPSGKEEEVATALQIPADAKVAVITPHRTRQGVYSPPHLEMNPVDRVEANLRDRSVSALVIVWTTEHVCRFGLPLDAVDELVMEKDALPLPWTDMLKRLSRRIQLAEEPEQFAKAAGKFLHAHRDAWSKDLV